MKFKNKGFTLVELIVVIVILAILIGVTIGGIYMYVGQSRANTDENNANAIQETASLMATDDKVYKWAKNNIEKGGYKLFTFTWKDELSSDDLATVLRGGTLSDNDAHYTTEQLPDDAIDYLLPLYTDGLPKNQQGKHFNLNVKISSDGDVVVSVDEEGGDPSPGGESTPSDDTTASIPDGLYMVNDGKAVNEGKFNSDGRNPVYYVLDGVVYTGYSGGGGSGNYAFLVNNEYISGYNEVYPDKEDSSKFENGVTVAQLQAASSKITKPSRRGNIYTSDDYSDLIYCDENFIEYKKSEGTLELTDSEVGDGKWGYYIFDSDGNAIKFICKDFHSYLGGGGADNPNMVLYKKSDFRD